MNLYELITPSDPITFRAESDKVAFLAALLLSNGKAGVNRIEPYQDRHEIPALLFLCHNPVEVAEEYLGQSIKEFMDENREKVAEALESFAYGSHQERRTYENALNAITEPEKLAEFKRLHEDQNRTSMSQWVKSAWNYGKSLRNAKQEKES